MKEFLSRDVPPGAALTVVALALLATLVTGREEAPGVATPAKEPARLATPAKVEPAPGTAADDLDLERLKRARKEGTVPELFAAQSWVPTAPPAAPALQSKPAAPPAPAAPPLPFQYLGRMVDGDKTVIFLARNQEPLSVTVGHTIENTYKVENVSDSAITFIYLPLGTQQTLALPPPQ